MWILPTNGEGYFKSECRPMSRDCQGLPSSQSFDGHVMPAKSHVNIERFSCFCYEIFRRPPPHSPLLAKTMWFQNSWRNLLIFNIATFILWSLSQSLSELVVWGFQQRNLRQPLFLPHRGISQWLSILPTIEQNVSCFSPSIQLAPQSTLSQRFNVANMWQQSTVP